MKTLTKPQLHLWTRSEYYQVADLGLFEDRRVELIEGQVFEMSPMGSLHATAVTLTAKILEQAFGTGYFTRWQMPFSVGEISEPEPDVAIIAGDIRNYKDAHPTTAVLIVEIADTSLEYDRTNKASLYAKAQIAEYWIVNLIDHELEVYRTPMADAAQPYGFGYSEATILSPTDFITPLARPQTTIAVADLLP